MTARAPRTAARVAAGLALAATLAAAAPDARAADRLDLAPLVSGVPGESFGAALALGDADGDGFADLLVGAPDAALGRGRVLLYRGSPSGLSGPPDFELAGEQPGERLGATLAYLGDVNDDGRADFAAAAPTFDGEGAVDGGRVFVLLGQAEPPWLRSSWIGPGPAGARLGTTLAGPGDLDGDGRSDLAIGAPDADLGAGLVEVHRGGDTAPSAVAAWSRAGAPGERLGARLGTAWDADGDGFEDLLVGAGGGATTLFFGAPTGTDPLASPIDLDREAALDEPAAAIGDLDGDGRSDLVAGAAQALGDRDGDGVPDYGALTTDGLVLYDGATGASPGVVACVCTPPSGWGSALAAGDVDGDGRTDLAIGAPSYPVAGLPSGAVYASLARAPRRFAARASWPATDPRAAVTALGDVDDDGFDDLLVPTASGLSLVLGAPPGEPLVERPLPVSAPPVSLPPGGAYLAAAADLDVDGRHDLVLATRDADASRVIVLDGDGAVLWSLVAPRAVGLGSWLAVGDVDDDGAPDLLVGADNDRGRATASLFRGRAGGLADVAAATDRGPPLAAGAPVYRTVGDLDAAAGTDLLAADGDGVRLLGAVTADAPWPPPGAALALPAPRLSTPELAGDVDGDGFDDLLDARPLEPPVLLRGRARADRADLPVGPAEPLPVAAGTVVVPVGDVDRDGRMDVVAVDGEDRPRVLFGPDFAAADALDLSLYLSISDHTPGGAPSVRAAPAGDVDGDGAADLLLTDPHGTRLLCAPETHRQAVAARARDLVGTHTLMPEVGTRVPGRFRVEARWVSLSGLFRASLEIDYARAGVALAEGGGAVTRVRSAPSTSPDALLVAAVVAPKMPDGQAIRWRARVRPLLATAPIQAATPWVSDALGPRAGTFRARPLVPVTAFPDHAEFKQGSNKIEPAPGVLANDTGTALFEGDQAVSPLTLDPTEVVAPLHGNVTLFPDGGYWYKPQGLTWGHDSFVYRALDAAGQSATAEVTLTITPIGACAGAEAEACRNAVGQATLRRADGSLFTVSCAIVEGVLACAEDDAPACAPIR